MFTITSTEGAIQQTTTLQSAALQEALPNKANKQGQPQKFAINNPSHQRRDGGGVGRACRGREILGDD